MIYEIYYKFIYGVYLQDPINLIYGIWFSVSIALLIQTIRLIRLKKWINELHNDSRS
jgi:hypothetical protein